LLFLKTDYTYGKYHFQKRVIAMEKISFSKTNYNYGKNIIFKNVCAYGKLLI